MTDPTKKRFLFISTDGLHVDCAWRILREGHEVRYCTENKAEADIGDGFVPKVEDWQSHVDWADVIVFDDVLGQGEKAAKLRARGKAVIGGTPYTDRLEDDRSFGQDELKKAGVNILPYREFDNFDDAITHVRENPRRYVIKPSGEAQNIKRLLFVGMEDDGSDVARVLEAYKRTWSDTIKIFQLQHKVTGVEVAVGGFFNGREFMEPININFEHKKLLPGNVGPATGEMGTSMFWSKPNKLYRETLAKLAPKLADEGYVGYIDVNCIVNSQGIYPLEFTARFGYPTIQIMSDGLNMPLADLFHQMATGGPKEFKAKKGFQIGVRLVVPPYPFKDKETFESFSKDAAIVFKRPNHEGVHIHDVKRVNDEWLVTGGMGLALVVTGAGLTMREAQKQAYGRIQNILIPNMYFRDDIGDRWIDDSDRLHTWGYLREN
ncbi:phosphoribosylamine--glycine ligase [Hyphobacterium sp.]|uniref:phosphoribosylamine--glycine ligase n=1 Tax=Hyphobacterium sp. TaxID=2004662 RepID=UPI003BAC5781